MEQNKNPYPADKPTGSSPEVDSVAQLVKTRYDLSAEYCEPYFDRFLDNYKHYFLRIIDEAIEADPDAYPFYSQLMIPISYQIVETILPRMFSRMPNFNLQTEEENDEADEAAFTSLVKYQMNHPFLIDDPVFVRLITALKECFITGNAWGVVPWYLKDIETFEWQPYSPAMGLNEPSWDNLEKIKAYGQQPEWKMVDVTKRVIDAPVFQHKSIFHVFPDPKKKRVSDLGWVIIEENMTQEEIEDMAKISPADYKNLDKLKTLAKSAPNSNTSKTNYDQELADIFGSSDFSDKDTTQGQFKVWFMHEPNRYCIVVNESLTIREGKNPNGDGKLGVFLMKDIPVPGELFAWGEPDPIKRIEDAMSDQANMRNDSVFYDLLKMFEVNTTALVDEEEFVPEPGAIVHTKEAGAIKAIDMGSTNPTAYKEYNEWEQIIQAVSGASDYATGQTNPSMNKTLGGIELLQQAANARFAMKLQLFEHLGLKAMGTMYVQRDLRFFDTPQNIITEKGKTQITPEQIRRIKGNVHFIVDTGSTEAVNQSTEQTKWTAIINSIGKPPFDQLTRAALDDIGLKFLYALKVPNPEEIMKKATDGAGAPAGNMGGFTQEQLQTIATLLQKSAEQTAGIAAQKAKESISINYKDAPPEIQRQMEKAAGFIPVGQNVEAPVQETTPTTPTPDQIQTPAAVAAPTNEPNAQTVQ